MQELDDYSEGGPLYKNGSLRNADSEIKHSTPSPTKYSLSPNKSYKVSEKQVNYPLQNVSLLNVLSTVLLFFFQYSPRTPPRWAEDQNSLLKMICQQVEAIKVYHLVSLNSALFKIISLTTVLLLSKAVQMSLAMLLQNQTRSYVPPS